MGKCGGHELNYVSDVDVIFVYEPVAGADEDRGRSRRGHPAGQPPDAGLLRPHRARARSGRSTPRCGPRARPGPLVRTLASHLGYYERWAKTWEFQALLKARPVAGDLDLGREYVDMVRRWSGGPPSATASSRTPRRCAAGCSSTSRPRGRPAAQARLGWAARRRVRRPAAPARARPRRRADPGAHHAQRAGRAHPGRYVGREDGEALHEAYAFLRTLEHRIQLLRLRRTHVVPETSAALRRRGAAWGSSRTRPSSQALAAPRPRGASAAREALLPPAAHLRGADLRAARRGSPRRPPATAWRRSVIPIRRPRCVTSRRSPRGVTRTSTIQRGPAARDARLVRRRPDPDAGLFGFRRISESLGRRPWYLKTLRDEGQVAERLAQLLATSRYASALLEREPQGVRLLGGDLTPLGGRDDPEEMLSNARRHDHPEEAVRAIRAVRRRELFRIATGDLLGSPTWPTWARGCRG